MNLRQKIIAALVLAISLTMSGCGPWQLLGSNVSQVPTLLPTNTPVISVSTTDGMILVYVPAGEFTMGSNDGDIDEKPVRLVYLDGFWIDKNEVT